MTEASLEKRSIAALCDAAVISVAWCCLVLPALSDALARPALLWPAPLAVLIAIGLLMFFAVEMLTGWTLGKWLVGLRVRRPDGSRAPVSSLAVRGAVKLAPVALCFGPGFVRNEDVREGFAYVGGILLLIVVTATYLGLVRIGKSAFDMGAGTVVATDDEPSGDQGPGPS